MWIKRNSPEGGITQRVVVGVLALDSLVTGMFVPLSLLYLQASSGETLARIGIILTIAGVVSLPVPLWVGGLVDSCGPKPLVLAAQLVQGLGFVGYLVARDQTLIFIAALIASAGQRIFWSSVFALASDVSGHDARPRARERWFGLIASLRAAGYGVGAVVGGVALTANPEVMGRVIVASSAVLLAGAAICVGGLVDAYHEGPEGADGGSYRDLWRDRPYIRLIAVNVLFCLANVMLSVALAPTIIRSGPTLVFLVGPLLVANTLIQAVLQVSVVQAVQKITRVNALTAAAALWATWTALTVSAFAFSRFWATIVLVASVLCYSFAQLIHGPLMNAISVDAAPPESRGRYLAAFQYSFAIASVIAPGMYATLTTVHNSLPWIVVGGLVALTIPLIRALARQMPSLHPIRQGDA